MALGKRSVEIMGITTASPLPAVVDRSFWQGRRVFVTGHTGFKGSWLCAWLCHLGATVKGYALAPITEPALFARLALAERISHQLGDVRQAETLAQSLTAFEPSVVFHLAAQPLVRKSYRLPAETFETNVMGTVNLLEAVRQAGSVEACVIVTSDKCYENQGWVWGYRESDPMGGHDPYSASKGCAELVTSAYRHSYFSTGAPVVCSARAGNVIGGGDWSEDRLLPDAVAAFSRGDAVEIRNPAATRPWQHVLEPLSGYLILAQRSVWDPDRVRGGWNFGPHLCDCVPVGQLVELFAACWGDGATWADRSEGPAALKEAHVLRLDTSKAQAELGWFPRWSLREALGRTADWYRHCLAGATAASLWRLSIAQIDAYQQE